jgi:glutamate synthase domain-containing protein 1/glutamate synthase domain-containing protein 3
VAVSEPVAGRHLIRPLAQMHNRGNGKGGGICAAGCFPDHADHYALHVGYLDPQARAQIEERHLAPHFDVDHAEQQPEVDDLGDVPGLDIRPPRVWRYFVRVKRDVLETFAAELGVDDLERAEDEFVYRNSFRLNAECYADREHKIAFVLSHGKDLLVLKGVGYAEEIASFYRLDELRAHVWIGHQRYPTRGRVWHPGGAHPFAGLHEALVHNGDFANYQSICTYLRQRNVHPQFLTDTEVAALVFDHYRRVLDYPLEWTIEAIAPTTERDFDLLTKVRQRIYRALRAAHVHGSPDGPWFFILARNDVRERELQLIGITDTSMLRPHVFALSDGPVGIGAVASEKQAIDAFLENLAAEDGRVCPVPDRLWSSRGGSHTDGGAFVFRLSEVEQPADAAADGGAPLLAELGGAAAAPRRVLRCTNKFGEVVRVPQGQEEPERPPTLHLRRTGNPTAATADAGETLDIEPLVYSGSGERFFDGVRRAVPQLGFAALEAALARTVALAGQDDVTRATVIRGLTLLRDRHISTGVKKRNWVVALIDGALRRVFDDVPPVDGDAASRHRRVTCPWREEGLPTARADDVLVIDATGAPPEGPRAVARAIVSARERGYRRFVAYNLAGDRFIGCGLGSGSSGVRIDCYGSTGDYTGSGLDGAELFIHGDAQDQLGQIMKSGKLVVFGDVGQAFLYGAKGGVAYVLGNAGGRALINAVGTVRAIINGTCLDYAGESFMAGADLRGGFVLLGGLRINIYGEVMGLEDRYPGSSFFSLASGGAGYVNDPYRTMTLSQLNGTVFAEFTQDDWEYLVPFLRENEALFGISIERDILTVDRIRKWPGEVFRKVTARKPERLDTKPVYEIGMVDSM